MEGQHELGVENDDESSSWSLESLEDIKHINLREMEEQAEPQEHREKTPLQPKFPPKPTFLPGAALHRVGSVVSVVGELLIVEGSSGFVVDLDNWVCGQERQLVGFVMDVLGRVESPFYAVRPEQQPLPTLVGSVLYYIEGTSRILRDEDIQSMKSKSALEAEELQDDSDSDEGRIDRDFSEEPNPDHHPTRQETHHNPHHQPHHQPHHRQDRQEREPQRDRTRERRQNSRGRSEHNQKYLESVYSAHYDQMMRLYSGGPHHHYPNNPYQHPMLHYQPPPQQQYNQPPQQQYHQLPQPYQQPPPQQYQQQPPQPYQQAPPPKGQEYGSGYKFEPERQSIGPQVANPFGQMSLGSSNIAHFGSTSGAFFGQQPPQPQ